jgi:hypothetical protein
MMNSDYCIELDGWADNYDCMHELEWDYPDYESELKKAPVIVAKASKKTSKKRHATALAAAKAHAQTTGQVIFIEQKEQQKGFTIVAPSGSIMTSHNTVLSPDGWETVVPRGKHRLR